MLRDMAVRMIALQQCGWEAGTIKMYVLRNE